MIITDKAQIKVAELRESNNLRLSGSDELECYELIESDLKLPADATFTRSSVAYLSDGTQVDVNTPRFEQGKFGKAVIVEEGTENLVNTGPSMAAYLSYVHSFQQEGNKLTIVKNNTPILAIRFVTNPLGSYIGKTLTISGKMKVNGVYRGWDNPYTRKEWSVLSNTFDENTGIFTYTIYCEDTEYEWIIHGTASFQEDDLIEIENLQVEEKPYPTSFTDGTRAAERLTIPTEGVLNPQEGTIEFWVKPLVVTNWNNFFNMPGLSNGRFLLYFASTGIAKFDYGAWDSGIATPSGIISANNWYHIVLRWSATTGKMALFVNGVRYEKNLPNGVADSFPASVGIVSSHSAYIDDLRISNRARTDEEILAAYQSGQPLPVDEWTTYKLDFDDKVRITTQGQIICNELIEI